MPTGRTEQHRSAGISDSPNRLAGAAEAVTYLRKYDVDVPQTSFDAAFGRDEP